MLNSQGTKILEDGNVSHNMQSISDKIIITTLGKFDVVKNGSSLVASSASSKKLWELYQFMFSNREKTFSPEALMSQLWIDADYSDPRSTLRRQMFRLRKLLGEDEANENEYSIIFKNGFYEWNNTISIELDSELFLAEIKKAEDYLKDSAEHALIHFERGFELYQNDYLPQCEELHWVYPIRNRYRHVYVNAVIQAAELMKQFERYKSLIELAEKAIQIDFYEEAFHYILMEAKLLRGEYKSIINHYQYMVNQYKLEMGVEPSKELKDLYNKVLQSHQIITTSESINVAFETKKEYKNAYYCEPNVFKAIFELELRKSEREGTKCSLGVLTVEYNKKLSISQNELYFKQLKEHLETHLRKGDALTQWNNQQIIVLLFGVGRDLTIKVLERILESINLRITITISQAAEINDL